MKAPLVLTIGQLNAYVKSLLDGDDNLNHVYVSAEISNFTNHYRTGHFYFSLKDENAVIRAVMFRSSAQRLKFLPQDGMRVIVRGRVSLYERDMIQANDDIKIRIAQLFNCSMDYLMGLSDKRNEAAAEAMMFF